MHVLKNDHGLGLAEAVMGAAVFGIVIAGAMQSMNMMMQAQKTSQNNLQVANISMLASMVLSAESSCGASLGGKTFNVASLDSTKIPLTELKFANGGNAVSVENESTKSQVYVKEIDLAQITQPDPGDNTLYFGEIQMKIEKRGGVGSQVSLVELPLSLSVTEAAGVATITACQVGGIPKRGTASTVADCTEKAVRSNCTIATFSCPSDKKVGSHELSCPERGGSPTAYEEPNDFSVRASCHPSGSMGGAVCQGRGTLLSGTLMCCSQ